FQPLGGVEREQGHGVGIVFQRIDIGDERRFRKKVIQAEVLALGNQRAQLLDVFEPLRHLFGRVTDLVNEDVVAGTGRNFVKDGGQVVLFQQVAEFRD